MDELRQLLQEMLKESLIQITLSNTRDGERAQKVQVRPVLIKDKLCFQETLYRGTQVFHENRTKEEALERIAGYLAELFRQGEIKTEDAEATVLVSKKGRMTVRRRGRKRQIESGEHLTDSRERLKHNRQKQYLLKEGEPASFLVGLGVQTPDGHVTAAKYDKFRQINRYLEFIDDVMEELPRDGRIRIIDFGCGKSYLTFAMYHYLHEVQGRDIEVTGLDLKTDVIRHCNQLAENLHYDHLHFERGDISSYEGADAVDMVVSLHACDTATDFALEKAVKWGAKVILAVPCCQHELNGQIKSRLLQPVLKYGLIKERMAALMTDALRANLLERQGYDVQILEFIDIEHTPKNLLIRAVRRKGMRPAGHMTGSSPDALEHLMAELELTPTLAQILKEQ